MRHRTADNDGSPTVELHDAASGGLVARGDVPATGRRLVLEPFDRSIRYRWRMELDESTVTAFWDWFRSVADELGEDLRNEAIHDEIDRRLEGFGDLQWELGPGEGVACFLAISPDGDPELLPWTRRIVALAPPIHGWEFLPARPARGPVEEFTMEGARGQEITVRTAHWRYTLLKYPDGMFHVVLEQGAIDGADEGERYAAASLFLGFALGEEQQLLRVAKIEPVESMDEDDARRSHGVAVIREHFESLGT